MILDPEKVNIVTLHGQVAGYNSNELSEIINIPALKEKNIDPKDAIFIDDNIRNVEAARKCKIDAIHFKDIKDLKMID